MLWMSLIRTTLASAKFQHPPFLFTLYQFWRQLWHNAFVFSGGAPVGAENATNSKHLLPEDRVQNLSLEQLLHETTLLVHPFLLNCHQLSNELR
jgi:hypothetical protein